VIHVPAPISMMSHISTNTNVLPLIRQPKVETKWRGKIQPQRDTFVWPHARLFFFHSATKISLTAQLSAKNKSQQCTIDGGNVAGNVCPQGDNMMASAGLCLPEFHVCFNFVKQVVKSQKNDKHRMGLAGPLFDACPAKDTRTDDRCTDKVQPVILLLNNKKEQFSKKDVLYSYSVLVSFFSEVLIKITALKCSTGRLLRRILLLLGVAMYQYY